MKGCYDVMTCELSLPRDSQPEKAAAADHEKVHQCKVVQSGDRDAKAQVSDERGAVDQGHGGAHTVTTIKAALQGGSWGG